MVKIRTPIETDRVKKLVHFYEHSPKFLALKPKTQYDYSRHLENVCATTVEGNQTLGGMRICDVKVRHISNAYEKWLAVGIRTANYRKAALSAAWRYAIQKEVTAYNPIALVDTQSSKPRRVKWTRDQVMAFLDVAYSDWDYRSIGLIVHMAYDWAQRIGDMRTLRWDNIDFDAQRMDLTQSKRNADVHLPIGDNLLAMLEVQRRDFGFQPYVAPRVHPRANSYSPYDMQEIYSLINEVKTKANLPDELTAMDLRRTAITEMVEAGVDMAGVMQVSGHRNPQSVKPYLVNTFSGASAALAKRNGNS